MLRVREEGWTLGTGSLIPFLALSPTSPMTLDKFQGHQIFRQLLFPLSPHLCGQSLAWQIAERAGKSKSIQHFGSPPFQRASPMLPFLPPHFQLIFQIYWGDKKMLQICAALWEIENVLGSVGGSCPGREEAIKKTLLRETKPKWWVLVWSQGGG